MNRVNRINRVNCMLARIGILGGILFSIGDALLFLTPHFDSEHDARLDWDAMPVWRFGLIEPNLRQAHFSSCFFG